MNFGKRLIGITLLFSMGFLTGLTVYSVLDRDSMNTNQGSLRGGRPNPLSGKFYDGLELGVAEYSSVMGAVKKGREEIKILRKGMTQELHKILGQAEKEIRIHLDDAQELKYEKFLDQWSDGHLRRIERRREARKSRKE